MSNSVIQILKSARLSDISRLTKRVLGMQYLSVDDFAPTIDPLDIERLRGLARRARGDGPAPILVLGVMPRSGTNFIHDLIGLHPDVKADPGRIWEFPLLHAARGATAFMDDFISLFPRNADVTSRWDAMALLAGAWLREHQVEAGSKHIMHKSPHVQNLSIAPHIFPEVKIILCLRDGRDVVDSSLKTFSRWSLSRKTFSQLAKEWQLSAEAILAFDESGAAAHPDVLVVRYEEAVSDPKTLVKRILHHTGLKPENYDFSKIEALPVRGSSRSDTSDDQRWKPAEKTADFKPVNRWASWSARRKQRFSRIAGHTLESAGYEK